MYIVAYHTLSILINNTEFIIKLLFVKILITHSQITVTNTTDSSISDIVTTRYDWDIRIRFIIITIYMICMQTIDPLSLTDSNIRFRYKIVQKYILIRMSMIVSHLLMYLKVYIYRGYM